VSDIMERPTATEIVLERTHEGIRRSANINEIATALSKAQGELQSITKDKTNPFYKSKYADLSSIWDVIRPILAKHGLAVIQGPTSEGSKVSITTILTHSSGQYFENTLQLTSEKATPQGVGSAITYGRRYSLSALLGIASDEDDDGNDASGKGDKTIKQPAEKKKPEKMEPPKKEPPKEEAAVEQEIESSITDKMAELQKKCETGITIMDASKLIDKTEKEAFEKEIKEYLASNNLDHMQRLYAELFDMYQERNKKGK